MALPAFARHTPLLLSNRLCSTHTHTHTFNGPFSRTTRVGQYQKSKTKLDFTEARDSEWQWQPAMQQSIDISCHLPAKPTAANSQQWFCCCGPMLGQTDG